jgi:hypothetical protein
MPSKMGSRYASMDDPYLYRLRMRLMIQKISEPGCFARREIQRIGNALCTDGKHLSLSARLSNGTFELTPS